MQVACSFGAKNFGPCVLPTGHGGDHEDIEGVRFHEKNEATVVVPIGGKPSADKIERLREILEHYCEGRIGALALITGSDSGNHDYLFMDAGNQSHSSRTLFTSLHLAANHLLEHV